MARYCADVQQGLSPEKSSVLKSLSSNFDFAALQKIDLWKKLEAAKKDRGCPKALVTTQ